MTYWQLSNCLASTLAALDVARGAARGARQRAQGFGEHDADVAGRAIPPRRIVVDAAIADVHPVHDRIADRRAALDYPSAHGSYVVTGAANGNADERLSRARRLADVFATVLQGPLM